MLLFGHVWDAKSDGRSELGRSSRRERSSGSPPSLPTARKGPLLSVRPSRGRSRGGNGAHPRREGDLGAAKGAADFPTRPLLRPKPPKKLAYGFSRLCPCVHLCARCPRCQEQRSGEDDGEY